MRNLTRRFIGPGLLLILSVQMAYALPARLPDFTELVERYAPTVVNISTTQKISRKMPRIEIPDFPEGSPFGDLFRRFFGDRDGRGGNDIEEFDSKSLGSGFIISQDGYILTAAHVVKGADEIIVRLSDRRELTAEIIGTDERSDVALLKIDAKNLPVVSFGSSTDLKVGEWVLAIGTPFGFEHSVTAGIVSAKGRPLPSESYVPFIQTDVAINPGNSGGPLFNVRGEVVGINSQIYSRTGGYMGLSFAIPIEMARDVAEQLKETGHVTRGWLGVLIQDVTRDLAESFGMKKPAGALVAEVLSDSPAEKAGVKVGDIIIEFDGKKIETSQSLPPIVGRTKVNSRVKVKLIREGKRRVVKVRLGELPSEEEVREASAEPGSTTKATRVGISVLDLNKTQRKSSGIEKGGVLVADVKKGPARDAGIRRGDIIIRIDNARIKDVGHFKKLVKSLPSGRTVAVLVQRRTGPMFLAMKIPK